MFHAPFYIIVHVPCSIYIYKAACNGVSVLMLHKSQRNLYLSQACARCLYNTRCTVVQFTYAFLLMGVLATHTSVYEGPRYTYSDLNIVKHGPSSNSKFKNDLFFQVSYGKFPFLIVVCLNLWDNDFLVTYSTRMFSDIPAL